MNVINLVSCSPAGSWKRNFSSQHEGMYIRALWNQKNMSRKCRTFLFGWFFSNLIDTIMQGKAHHTNQIQVPVSKSICWCLMKSYCCTACLADVNLDLVDLKPSRTRLAKKLLADRALWASRGSGTINHTEYTYNKRQIICILSTNYLFIAFKLLNKGMSPFQAHSWHRLQIVTTTQNAHLKKHLFSETTKIKFLILS